MLTFRDITERDRDVVIPMVQTFYKTDAVDHPVPLEIIQRSFSAVIDQEEPLLRGVLVVQDGQVAGYLYLSPFYSAEMGGRCVMIEEIFFLPEFRGQGLGRKALAWLQEEYPEAKRFRLEVTQGNPRAAELYRRCGFQWLNYRQMVLDRAE